MIRGWCPTVHAPMLSGDGLLVRVKPFGGRLSAPALAALAEAAACYGNGIIELTSRGNLQIRGMHAPADFAAAMVAAGLADPDPAREARRNVTALPGSDDALVAEAEAVLSETPGLPAKFGVSVDGSTIFVAGQPIARDAETLRRALFSPFLEGGVASGTHRARVTPPSNPLSQGEREHLLYLPLGQTDAATLAHLASLLALRDIVRTTPWRALLSPIRAPGFGDAPNTITACPGAPACSSGSTPARADAATLQAAGFTNLHVSGCAKGCAYPRPATTLVGGNGRYDLIRHGRAGDRPDLTGLTLAQAMAAL